MQSLPHSSQTVMHLFSEWSASDKGSDSSLVLGDSGVDIEFSSLDTAKVTVVTSISIKKTTTRLGKLITIIGLT